MTERYLERMIGGMIDVNDHLITEYDEIDPRRVHEGLMAAVRDIPEYLRHVHDYLEGLTA